MKERTMYIQIVNFHLKERSETAYAELCDQVAPAFADLPGLISKVWLADAETNTFGGVYTWESREAMDAFTQSDLFRTVATHPNLDGITSKSFNVMAGPTRLTRGMPSVAV
jgi:heme-degrading monooxygenase HmoA